MLQVHARKNSLRAFLFSLLRGILSLRMLRDDADTIELELHKILIFCAPSGAGKTTIANAIISKNPNLSFSISATNRPPRGDEKNGVEYYFVTTEEFKRRIDAGEFVEWEEVYPGRYYGTLKSEIHRMAAEGKTAVFDVDVKGAVALKRIFGQNALLIFIKAPVEAIQERLRRRNTEEEEAIQVRLARVSEELSYEPHADTVIENIDLQKAIAECEQAVTEFLNVLKN
jgi:guanylate kinase